MTVSKSRTLRVCAAALLAALIGCTLVPAGARAAEKTDVAQQIADHLVVPDGVTRGIELSDEGVPQGLSPEYGRISSDDADDAGAGGKTSLPAKFDLRSKGAVTPVKNQYRWTDCWVFSATASLESSMLMQRRGTSSTIDYSEKQLTAARRSVLSEAQAASLGASGQGGEGVEPLVTLPSGVLSSNAFLLSYGHITEVADAVFSGMGPVAEKDAPFLGQTDANGAPLDSNYPHYVIDGIDGAMPAGDTDWSLKDPFAYDPLVSLDEYRSLGTLAIVDTAADGTRTYQGMDQTAATAVKEALMDGGAVALELYPGRSLEFYDYFNHTQYVSEPLMYSHLVTIVGWDDTMPRENFRGSSGDAEMPPADGAWIIKDSYGTKDDDLYPLPTGIDGTGYFYVSYYDQSLRRAGQLIAGDDVSSNDVTLQYDLLGTSPFSDALLTSTASKTANVFTADQDMYLEATTVSSVTADADATVQVYLLGKGARNPTDGVLVAQTRRSLDSAGRFRVELPEPVALQKGQRFSIVEEVRQDVAGGGSQWYLAIEGGTTKKTSERYDYTFCWHAKANAGESYVMIDGSWADVRTLNSNDALTSGGENVYGNAMIKAYGTAANLPDTSGTATMYRLYNRWTGEHFYTASTVERDKLKSVGWDYEGVGWTAPTAGDEVWRLYNPFVDGGDHHYTLSESEYDALEALGWKQEGIGWRSGGSVEVWRQYNPYAETGTHNYTPDGGERDALARLGWKDEGVGWFAVR